MNKQVAIVVFLFGLVLNVAGQVVPDEDFNTLLRTENGGWVAGDATFSVALPDGRTMWLFGDRLIAYEDYTYIFGRKEENPDWHIPYVHLARAEVGNLYGEWEFYDGSIWSTDPGMSVRVTDHPVSQQYGVFMHEEKFVMITQEIWLGTTIYSLTADQPEGPWENITELYNTPHPFPDMLTYNAYPHPQFDENNALLVSYNSKQQRLVYT